MDDSVQAASRAFSGQPLSIDENKNMSSILSEHHAASVSNDNKDRGREDATWKCPYVFLFFFKGQTRFLLLFARKCYPWLILDFITKPYILFSMFLSIAMPIGIIIVYFNAPKQISKFFFFYTLVIQHDQNQKVGSFLHKYRGSAVKKR